MSRTAKWLFEQIVCGQRIYCAHDKYDNDIAVRSFAARLIAGDY